MSTPEDQYADPEAGIARDELLRRLRALHGPVDEEAAHSVADDLLLAYINDPEVAEAFDKIHKWYA